MKIGIYDKWLNTLGGGERVASTIAEILSQKGHNVYLIGNAEIEKKEIEDKMGVDLSKVNLISWFERSYDKLSPLTKKFDLLINTSYLDHLPSQAKRSFYYVHFPTPIRGTLLAYLKYELIVPFLRRFLIIPSVQLGVQNLDDIYSRRGKWLSSNNNIIIYNTTKKFNLTFRIYDEKIKTASLESVTFSSPNCELDLIDRYIDHFTSVLTYKFKVKLLKDESPFIKIYVNESFKKRALGLVSLTVYDVRYFLWNCLKRFFPLYEMALYGSSSYKPAAGLDTYETFISNSEFTKKWTKRYLNKDAIVIYPPVDVKKFKPRKKKNTITNVGRFFVGGHSKKQDVLVKAFKEMVDNKMLDKAWELHLLGGVAIGEEHEKFINDLENEAKGYKIFFHFLPSFKELEKIVSESKIYWHATGFGLNEKKSPIQFEHFGIAIVEAMAGGAVPVVYNGGGLPEIVNESVGRVWKTIDELEENTFQIVENENLRKKLSLSAQKSSERFSKKNFADKLIALIERYQK